MSAPAARAERLSLPIRRRVRARIAHQLAIRTGSPKLIARRSAAATRGREADISIPRVLSSQPQKACNHEYHDDYANDVKHFDPPTRSATSPAASDHIGIPSVADPNYPAQVAAQPTSMAQRARPMTLPAPRRTTEKRKTSGRGMWVVSEPTAAALLIICSS
jgi:hypothetical protein